MGHERRGGVSSTAASTPHLPRREPMGCAPATSRDAILATGYSRRHLAAKLVAQATPRRQRSGVPPRGGPPCGPPGRTWRRRRECGPVNGGYPRHPVTSHRREINQRARRHTGSFPRGPNAPDELHQAREGPTPRKVRGRRGGADPCAQRGARPTTFITIRNKRSQDPPSTPVHDQAEGAGLGKEVR